jgi:hypothetical protein
MLSDANIVVENKAGSGASGQSVLVPAHDTNSSIMAMHTTEFGAFFDIPYLDLTSAKSNADVGSIPRPLNTADIGVRACFEKRANSSRFSRPDINIAFEANGDLVAGRPVKKVKIVIVHEPRGIQDALGGCCNTTSKLGRGGTGILEGAVVL